MKEIDPRYLSTKCSQRESGRCVRVVLLVTQLSWSVTLSYKSIVVAFSIFCCPKLRDLKKNFPDCLNFSDDWSLCMSENVSNCIYRHERSGNLNVHKTSQVIGDPKTELIHKCLVLLCVRNLIDDWHQCYVFAIWLIGKGLYVYTRKIVQHQCWWSCIQFSCKSSP